ncbi:MULTISPECIES: hypothetical protein [Streptomyces]|uniref:V/A-type H+-transporting ATPase subunit K n=1 Tax=Streptomyces yunnanensis TaxID=156453 RepID=A0ABY8AC14_9ACTN|nr:MULTISPECIES: hypothetical protein [Streptomyces]AJC56708.1 hypothetical protein GZL_04126 [Streptomyces sp. 769]WEB41052.1 hypothetical protein MOV08_18365 [Streptomyces yunnanensis]
MPSGVDGLILAGVAHVKSNYDAGWGPGLLLILGVFGCLVVCAGAAVTRALLRVEGEKNWVGRAVGPVIFAMGLAMTVVGFGFSFGLL